MIGIVINHDVIAIPQPVGAIAEIESRDREEKPADRESIVVAAVQSPHMTRPPAARKVAVLPGMIEVIVRIIASAVMAYPPIAIGVHMGSSGVSRAIAGARRGARVPLHGGRTVRGDVPAADGVSTTAGMSATARMLTQRTEGGQQCRCAKSRNCFHG